MKRLLIAACAALVIASLSFADTIGKYAEIAQNIPKMSLKADEQAQAWARSAKSILAVTDETMAQTIQAMNQLAYKHNSPLLCLPQGNEVTPELIHETLEKIIAHLRPEQSTQTISNILVQQLQDDFSCQAKANISSKVVMNKD